MPGRSALPTGASAALRSAGGRGRVAAARACPPGTGMAAGARGTGGTRWCGGAFCWVTALSRAGGPAPHHLGGGGTLQARPGPRLRSRLARTSLRGGRAPGPLSGPRWAGPAARGGGGGATSSRPLGSGRGAPLPFPRAHTARAAARRAWSCPAPCAPRASLPLGRHRLSSPPPSPRLCPWGGGGGRPVGPPRGGEGGGWWPPALLPGRARGAAVPFAASSIRTPALFPPPRRPRWPLPPRRWSSEARAEAQAGSRAGTSRCIRCESHVVRGAVCGRRRPPSEEVDGASRCPLRLGQPCACWAVPRACRSGRGGLYWGLCVATRGGEVTARRRCAAPLVPAAGLLWGRALHLRSQPWAGGEPGHGLSRRSPRGALPGLPGGAGGAGAGGWESRGGGD